MGASPSVQPLSEQILRWLVPWRTRPWPLPWEEVFGRDAPLAVEVGFGNGAFLAREARRHPERDHVGIEVSWESATHLFRRLDREGRSNVRVLLADADVALGLLFTSRSIAEAFVNHPCPWPKARHEERRLVRPEFVALLADRLEDGASVTIATDHPEYARWIAEVLESQSALRSRHAATEVAAIADREATKYELKAMAAGAVVHYFEWARAGTPERLPPQPEHHSPDAMPSLSLRGAHDPGALFAGFTGASAQERSERTGGVEVFAKLVAAWRRAEEPLWLVEALVQEGKLRQEFGIEVVPRDALHLLVKLSALGRPHPTYGVKRAVWLVGEWLCERHPTLRIEHENVGSAKG